MHGLRAGVGRERRNYASYLFPSCRKAACGLAQPALHALFPPWKWEKFPMRLDWPDLQAEHSHLFQEAFS